MNKDTLKRELMQAADGLLLDSEIEAPFEFVYFALPAQQTLHPADVAQHAGKPAGTAVKVIELDAFLQQVQGITSDARTSTPHGQAARQQLTTTLHRLLQDVKVYCIAQMGTDAYLLGRTDEGHYAGFRTILIQGEATVDDTHNA